MPKPSDHFYFFIQGRWKNNLLNKLAAQVSNKRTVEELANEDISISPKIRQLLQHWGYRVTEKDITDRAKR